MGYISLKNLNLELLEQEEDAAIVLEVIEEMDFGFSKKAIRAVYPSPKMIIGRITNNLEIASIAKVSDKVVGFATVFLTPYEKTLASLYLCGVKEEFRRKEIGKSALNLVLDKCEKIGVRKVTCMVPSENVDGLVFLIKCGFKPSAYLSDAYSLKKDGILMFRYLQDGETKT